MKGEINGEKKKRNREGAHTVREGVERERVRGREGMNTWRQTCIKRR